MARGWLQLLKFEVRLKKEKVAEKRKELGDRAFEHLCQKINNHCIANPTYNVKRKHLFACMGNFAKETKDERLGQAQVVFSDFWAKTFGENKTGYTKSENAALIDILERIAAMPNKNTKKPDATVLERFNWFLEGIPQARLAADKFKLVFIPNDFDNIVAEMRAAATKNNNNGQQQQNKGYSNAHTERNQRVTEILYKNAMAEAEQLFGDGS